MAAKAFLLFCAQALLIQSALSQCTSRAAVDASGIAGPYGLAGPAFPYGGLAPFAYDGFAAPCGLAGPLAYDGYLGPYAYDGLAGLAGRGFAYDGFFPALEITPTTSGGLTVTSASAIPPTGISVISENAYEGILTVAGEVPFVGTTGMEGVLPTAGSAAVNHACGNGINIMVSETTAFIPGYGGAVIESAFTPAIGAAIAPALTIAPAAAYGCGCGVY